MFEHPIYKSLFKTAAVLLPSELLLLQINNNPSTNQTLEFNNTVLEKRIDTILAPQLHAR